MPGKGKSKKSPQEWENDLRKLAGDNTMKLTGKTPSKQDAALYGTYNKIKNCPARVSSGKGKQVTLGAAFKIGDKSGSSACTCGYGQYHKKNKDPPPVVCAEVGTEATPPPPPPTHIPFNLPKEPKPLTSKLDIVNQCYTKRDEGYFPLTIFGYTYGKCIHCGRDGLSHTSVNKSIKIIHTKQEPKFLQGIGLKCNKPTCADKPGFQSFEKSYVDTLHPRHRQKLDAVVVGSADGIDMALVFDMRMGNSASSLEDASRAYLTVWWNSYKDEYKAKVESAKKLGPVVDEEFPDLIDRYVAKGTPIIRAFLRDYITHRDSLNREMATLQSTIAISIDHQHKVVKKVKGKAATQSFSIMGDGGLVLGHYAVPSSEMKWVHTAMMEVVERHGAVLHDGTHMPLTRGNLPPVIYVDKDCCNGHVGGRNDVNKWLYGMLKKLDPFHMMNRIGGNVNSEHPRKGGLMRNLSKSIYTDSQEDTAALADAREKGGITNLSPQQIKDDRIKRVRKVIVDPNKIAAKMLLTTKKEMALDRQAKLQHQANGESCIDLPKGHDAYPVVTGKVLNALTNQCTHVLNGCVHDEVGMNISVNRTNYRGTGVLLAENKSMRGTNKNEYLHSYQDRVFYSMKNIRQGYYNARAHWSISNWNRRRLETMGRPSLSPGVAPMEDSSCPPLVASTNMKFGFDYLNHVIREMENEIDDAVLQAVDEMDDAALEAICDDDLFDGDEDTDDEASSASSLAAEDAPYPAVDNVDIPSSVNFEALDRIASELEASAPSELEASAPPNNESVAALLDSVGGINLNNRASLEECNNMANEMADGAGLSDFEQFDVVGAERVCNRTNVALRRRQTQQESIKGPDFNPAMEAKWVEIYSSGPKPGDGSVGLREWFIKSQKEYKIWMLRQQLEAIQNDKSAPELFSVDFHTTKEWVSKMKAASSRPLATGAVNAAAVQIAENYDQLMNDAIDEEVNEALFQSEGGLGVARSFSDIETNNSGAAGVSENVFNPPSSEVVGEAMPNQPKRRKKSDRGPEYEASRMMRLHRQGQALGHMNGRGIQADPKVPHRQRCGICYKYYDFEFEGMGHLKNKNFCPLGDPSWMWDAHLREEQEKSAKRKESNAKYYQKKPHYQKKNKK